MVQYRIEWKSKLTGYTSHGDWFNSNKKEMLNDTIISMNKKYCNDINHWLASK